MGSVRRGCASEQRAPYATFVLGFNREQCRAFGRLAKSFPMVDERGKRLPSQAGQLARNLALISLAHVETSKALLVAMIRYCEAEGLAQQEYLGSMIKMKFNKVHRHRKRRRRDF